ncbi:MAG: autotransporter-associated beta strand repeat-containing protein, partial [Prosthecobacter sp.]
MKAKQPMRSSWTSLGIFILPLIGAGVFWAFSSSAQSSVDGSWFPNGGGSWGTRTNWSYSDSLRPAAATISLNPRAQASATRLGDKIVGINVSLAPGGGGSGYTTPPIVIIPDPGVNGRPARAVAQLLNGVVNSITVVDGGAGYTFAGTLAVTISGEVDEATMSEVGSGYSGSPSISFNGGGAYTSPPTVTFRGGIGSGAEATAVIGTGGSAGRLVSITVNNGGIGYSTTRLPTVQIITTTGGSGATATAIVDGGVDGGPGVITGFTVVTQGTGYSTTGNLAAPSINIVSPTPTDLATGSVVIEDGQVIDVEIINPGTGYTTAPQVILTGGGAVGNGNVLANSQVNEGSVTGVTVVDPGGVQNATATAVLGAGGGVSTITLNSRGRGYTSVPSIVIGAPLIRQATVASTRTGGSVSAVAVTNPGAGYLVNPTVTFANTGWQGYSTVPRLKLTTGSGAVASAARNVSTQVITAVSIQDPGLGYTVAPTVSFVGGGGTGATATATLTSGRVTGVTVTGGGAGYTSDPRVVFTSNGIAGAQATASVTPGAVSSVVIGNRGSGYATAPTVSFVGGGGSGAAGTATVSGGFLTGLTITNAGSGYGVAPSVVLTGGGGSGATVTAYLSYAVSSVVISNGGSGYTTAPTVSFVGGNGSGATATASVAGGILTGINLTNAGAGYGVAPVVTLIGGGGSGGVVTTVVSGGSVTGFSLISRGTGYTTAPTVFITPANPAMATATLTAGVVTGITVTSGGAGYTSAPLVVFSSGVIGAQATAVRNATNGTITSVAFNDAGLGYTVAPTVSLLGGNGTGAAATAAVDGGQVTSFTITGSGTGYGVAPGVVLTGGGGTGAVATAVVAGGLVTNILVTNPGSGYSTAPSVSFTVNTATATATISAGKITQINMVSNGSGYTSVPTVAFTTGGVTFGVLTALVPNGQLSGATVVFGGSGYVVAPTVSFEGGVANGGLHATATALLNGGSISGLAVTSPGGAVRAVASSTRAADGSIDSVTVTNPGTGYIVNPIVTLAAPTGITTSVQPVPGGVGSFIHFNRDITGNVGITLDAARTVGSFTIGDTGGEDYSLSAGTGAVNSTLIFDMGLLGAGKSFLNKTQGDQDVISARLVLNDQLNARINNGRVTLSGGIAGAGTLVSTGNGILTVRGDGTGTSNDLWLWHRGSGNTGAQVELGTTGASAFGNIRLGNGSFGTAGFAVLQLLENRVLSLANPLTYQGDQIGDSATVLVDAATNRWGYFKLMGGSETIGNILDPGSALVLENMEGETINTSAVLTLGGNNLNSYIGGFIRNRASGGGTGTLGLTKNGTGSLTLQGGNITYTGATLLNAGTLNLINTTNFASAITAAAGTRLNIDTLTGTTNFDDDVLGNSVLRKVGTGTLNFNSGKMSIDEILVTAGTMLVRTGSATLRGGKNEVTGALAVQGNPGVNRALRIEGGFSVGSLNAQGLFGQNGGGFDIAGQPFSVNGLGNYAEGVLESSREVNLANMGLRLNGTGALINRTVQNNATDVTSVVLNDVANLIIGSVLTLQDGEPAAGVSIKPDTKIVAISQNTRTVILSQTITIPSGRGITFTYTSNTDGAIRGESLNFTDVTHDGQKFIAITEKGTVHTSRNGTLWDLRYTDPARLPFNSLAWTGERAVIVGNQGRVLTSTDGLVWTVQDVGSAVDLRGVTTTNVSFTGNLVVGSTTVSNVTGAASYQPGTPIFGFATPSNARVSAVNAADNSMTMDSAALDTATNVDFGYFRGDTTTGNNAITNVKTAQNLQVGTAISVSGVAGVTTITIVDGPNNRITLSSNAPIGGTVALNTLTGDLTLNSSTISNLSNTQGLAVGMRISGRGIPAGTRILALDVGASTLVLSDTVTTTATAAPMSIYTGTLTSGSQLVQNVSSLGSFTAEMAAHGVLVPVGTFVVSSTSNTLLLSQSASAAATSGDLKATKTRRISTGTFVLNDALVTGVTNVAGLAVGMQVSLPGVISPGTVINAINGTDVTLSSAALAPAATQAFSVGFDLVTVGRLGFVSTSAGGGTSTWLSRTSGTTRDLNSITWSESLLVAVGSLGRVITSTDGVTWSRQGPPLVDTTNVILAVNTGSKTVTLNNNAMVTSTQASFGAFKGNTTSGSAVITNVTGMPALRAGMPLASALGTPAGTTIRSVNEAGFSLVMSTPATATLAAEPIRTFTGLSTNGSSIITEVRDFKGLAVGMSLHGSSITGTAVIIALDPANRRLFLANTANASGQNTFGVFYGDLVIGSATVSNVTNLTSVRNLQGTEHLTPGKAVTPSGPLGSGLTISSYNVAANSVTLSGASIATSSVVPLLTFSGNVIDGSNIITGVSDFTGLAVNMNILVTGTTFGSSAYFSFNIDALNPTAGTITLSGVPNVNTETTSVTVPLGIFLGTTTALSNTVTNLTNRTNQQAPSISLPDLQDVAWTGTQFVAVGHYGAVFTSSDGSVWTPQNPATGRDLQTVALSGAEILTAGQDGLILKSANGTAWSVVRAADSPALNDVRHIDQIQAVLTNSGQTLALGNGGLATTNVNTWSSSLNDTFSGSQITISIAGRTQSSGVLQISNTVTTTTTTTPQNGIVQTRNSTNRFDDAATLLSRGGDLIFANNGVNATFSETIGKLVLGQGQLQISAYRAGLTGTSTLTFGSLERLPGATVDFIARENVTGLVNLPGTLGVDARNRVLFTQNPVLDQGGLIGGWATIDGEWATYDPVKGVMRLDPTAGYDLGDQPSWTLTDNVKMQAGRTLNARRAVNSMNIQGQTLTMNGQQLSVESGGILATTATIGTATLGDLTVGTAINVPKTLNVINSSTVTINAAINDFTVTLNAPVTSSGSTTVTLPNVIGLLPGMAVSGLGIPAGTRIESVDRSGTNRVTLTAATTVAMPVNTPLTFKGGSVGLSKSGAGLLLLTNTNDYTGKTYVNNGTLRITSTGALGTAPTSFVQDQIQVNGAILQIGHVVSGTVTPLPNFNVAFNDGFRGVTIGYAGGRIEVGQSNPDNDNATFTSAVPIVNLTISNPINALGVLELAVRAGTGNAATQFNTLTLGTSLSTNTYAAGIRTEAGFEGRINLLGNNTIGGISQEGGRLFITGNNNFTAPIRSLLGDITINGTNTWLGTNEFEQPIDMQAGTLRLSTQTALGTGGLNLVLGSSGVLMLQGLSQTIRQIASSPLSVISNDEAPNGFVGSTNLIFDLSTNQTYSGTIEDGVTVGPNNDVAPIKLIKTGPGTLTLNNADSDFTGGIEILGGALNVTAVSALSNNSALGKVVDFDPAMLVIDKAVLSFAPTDSQTMDRSFTLGSGPNGAALVANGATQIDRVTIGKEFRDPFGGNPSISTPIAFKDAGSRVLTLSGSGRGDNTLLLELRDKSISEVSGLLKAGQGNWVLGKAAPFSGLTSINDGTLVVTKNDALGTAGASTVVDAVNDTFTGNLPNGTRLTFPFFFDTTLPGGVLADTAYYVVGSNDGSTFQIAATLGGAALPITTNGSNVKIVPKIDSFRSTVFDDGANTFTGNIPNGSQVSFNTQTVAGVATPQAPAGLLTNTVYFVKESNGSTFEISETLNGPTFNFGSGTPGALYYTTNATGNASGGVNLASGILELRNVDYLTPETIIFEGGSLVVPADTQSIWSGNLEVNATSTIRVGQGGQLLLNGNLLGTGFIAQEGEGTLVMRGEMLTPTTNLLNSSREYAVRAGTLLLDYALNNGSKLSDVANLRLGGSRRGGTVILSGGSHDEVVGQTVLEAGASKIYRESGTSTLSLNNVLRSTGSSLYVDVGRIVKTDVLNNNGILGAWAIIRDAVTNAFWVIPGTNSFTIPVTANENTDRVSATTLAFGTLIRFTTTGTMPGGLNENTNYFVINANPDGVTLGLTPSVIATIVDITSPGTGTLTLTAQTTFTANAGSNTFSTSGDHRLARGSKVRVSSYGTLPSGLNAGTDYYVIDRANRNFRLSTVIDGPAIDITSSGTGVHVVSTEGAEKRVGSGALTFAVNAIALPGVDGNGRIKVAIRPQATSGVITSEITGSGTVPDPYIYTIKTTTDSNNNSAVLTFVSGDPNNPAVGSGKLILAESSAGGSSDADLVADTGSYGAPTFLANGSSDNGSNELDWARNEGAADGLIMPTGSYLNAWGPGGLSNTSVTSNITVANRDTFSLRFATQNASTVTLSGVNAIRSGGILISPTVGANDSSILGTGSLTMRGEGNLQNFLIHQYNELGSLVIGSKITNRSAAIRTGRLTGADRRVVAGLSATNDLSVGMVVSGAGITNGTVISSIDPDGHTVFLSQDHGYNGARPTLTFTSGPTTVTRTGTLSDGYRRRVVGVTVPAVGVTPSTISTSDLYIGMPISGPG